MPVPEPPAPWVFTQLHIDVARNATDDFNLFHDPNKWQRIQGNPFGGPIALGFQLECLVEEQLRLYRQAHDETGLVDEHGLRFSNYQFTFAGAARPGEALQVDIKKSRLTTAETPGLSNRVVIKNGRGVVLIGHKRESPAPLCLADADLAHLPDLRQLPDRSYIPGDDLFCKRKFMSTGHAKNFLTGSLANQAAWFDELEERVRFPEMFPAALISCALLERAFKAGHDFEQAPMVYTSHHISVDRELTARLMSNDVLHLLVDRGEETMAGGLGGAGIPQLRHRCFGLLGDGTVLFRAEIALAPLAAIINLRPDPPGRHRPP